MSRFFLPKTSELLLEFFIFATRKCEFFRLSLLKDVSLGNCFERVPCYLGNNLELLDLFHFFFRNAVPLILQL